MSPLGNLIKISLVMVLFKFLVYVSAHPNISDELKDSVTAHLTRMEGENEEMRHQLEELRQKLQASERDHEKAKVKLEQDYERKVAQIDQQTREIRHRTSIQLTKEFEAKVLAMEKQGAELKRRINQEYRHRMTALEAECTSLKKQVDILQESWTKDKEQSTAVLQENRELKEEKEMFKETINTLKRNSGCKFPQLEQEVDLNSSASELQSYTAHVTNVAADGIANRDGAKYIMRRENSESDTDSLGSRSSSQQSLNSNFSRDIDMGSYGHPSGTSTPKGPVMRHKPARGVVAPQRRSLPPEREPQHVHHSTPFRRDDPHRASTTPMRPKSDHSPFARNNYVRASMPERKTVYVVPERRSRPTTPVGHSYPSPEKVRSNRHSSGSLSKEKSASRESFSEKIGRFISRKTSSKTEHNSDRDSGHATSPGSPNMDDSQNSNHILTSLSIVSSETIRTQIRSSQTPKMDSKWKMFVDKIVDLQDKNQQLIVDNSELRRTMGSIKYAAERLDTLEQRNLQLEVENRKLIKIIGMLQGSGRNPHDNRLYHFYSNV